MIERDKIIVQINNSTKIYLDIKDYVDQSVNERKIENFRYFKDFYDVKNYLIKNKQFIDQRLLNPTKDLWEEYGLIKNKYQTKDTVMKICPTCGKQFEASSDVRIYCNSRCWKLYNKEKFKT